MEKNKNLVVGYSYYVEKENPEEKEVAQKIYNILSNLSKEKPSADELGKLMCEQTMLEENRRVKVYKEYPEFLVKDFKTIEELLDFIDEDEPNIYINRDIWV